MSNRFSYKEYVSDETFLKDYSEYQKRYAENIRESDRVLIQLIRNIVDRQGSQRSLSLLDIGCSTGNLLLHIKHALPELELTGGDMTPAILEQCKSNPVLSGISFKEKNMLELGTEEKFDIITSNAVLYMFGDDEFERALESVAGALKPDGWFLAFDFFHPFEQDLAIFEKSKTHPNGLMLHFRQQSKVLPSLEKTGFQNISFRPFLIPIDLEMSEDFSELNTYTRRAENGERMLFRGTLFQPWCHLLAQKRG
jgi:SAM-dependent methyltransferase